MNNTAGRACQAVRSQAEPGNEDQSPPFCLHQSRHLLTASPTAAVPSPGNGPKFWPVRSRSSLPAQRPQVLRHQRKQLDHFARRLPVFQPREQIDRGNPLRGRLVLISQCGHRRLAIAGLSLRIGPGDAIVQLLPDQLVQRCVPLRLPVQAFTDRRTQEGIHHLLARRGGNRPVIRAGQLPDLG